MSKSLMIYPEKCLGCRICEMFCSLSHTDTCNSSRSRINVIKADMDVRCVPMMCQKCVEAPCEKVCPTDAIHRDRISGAMVTDRNRCIGCRACLFACPFGGTSVDPWERIVIRCDLCDGEPRCAEVCPHGAITFVEDERQGLYKKRMGAEKFLSAIERVEVK
jgi:Fe-S-cluster-containing hydrogenase component 2